MGTSLTWAWHFHMMRMSWVRYVGFSGWAFCSLPPLAPWDLPSVQFSHSVVSDSLRPHGLQHTRLPWYHQLPEFTQTHVCWVGDAIQPSHPLVIPFSSFLQSFPASFVTGSQSIGVSVSASVLPMSIQDWFPLGWVVWSPYCPQDSQESSLIL